MRVGVDVRKIRDGGIGVYLQETMSAATASDESLEVVAFGHPENRDALAFDVAEWVDLRAGGYSLAEHWELPRALAGRDLDLFHAPHYVLPFGTSVPAVVTVHDLIHLLFPRTPLHRAYARTMIASACRRARRVIAVSETTARDLREHLSVPAEKIRVIPNGVSSRFRGQGGAPPASPEAVAALRESLGIEERYILYVGNRLPHKNVERLVNAWAQLGEGKPGLVLCGQGYEWGSPFWRAVGDLPDRERIVVPGTVGSDSLVALYVGAEALVLPSLYEGFGLPAVEAMACGTPVVAAEAGSIPEVVGAAAEWVEPTSVTSIRDGMRRVLNDGARREEMIREGRLRAQRYSWAEAGRETLALYREALEDAA